MAEEKVKLIKVQHQWTTVFYRLNLKDHFSLINGQPLNLPSTGEYVIKSF